MACPWDHPSWSNGLIAHYSGEVDFMNGISYLLVLVDLPCGGELFIRGLHYLHHAEEKHFKIL